MKNFQTKFINKTIKLEKKFLSGLEKPLLPIFISRLLLENNKVLFKSKKWLRNSNKDEGGGESKLLENGKVFDKVGVNFSEVYGKFPNKMKGKIPGTKKIQSFGQQVYQLLCT